MSIVLNDTSYSGTFASYFWLPATFGMDTVEKGVVYVKDGIKKKHTIGRIDFQKPLQPRAATPISGGDFTISGRDLEPKDMMLYTEFNPRDFEDHWLAEQLSPTLLARELPVQAETFMTQMALNRTFEQIEGGLWMASTSYTATAGDTGNGQLKFFDGFLKKMVADSAVQKVASPGILVTGATTGGNYNIFEALDALIALGITNKKALLSRPNRFKRLKFICSVNTEQIYQKALQNLTQKGIDPSDGVTPPYRGYQVVSVAGMPDNTIVFAEALDDSSSNLYVGMNSVDDNDLQLQRLQANSELYFLKGLMKYDVEYGWSEEVFLFTTLVAGDFSA